MLLKPKIFVSSRFNEFVGLRSELTQRWKSFEQDLPFSLVSLDDGQPDARSSIERSLSEIESCSAVLLLLGRSYSDSSDSHPSESGVAEIPPGDLSTTHREYRRARELNLDIWAFSSVPLDEMNAHARSFYEEVSDPRNGVVVGKLSMDSESQAVDNVIIWIRRAITSRWVAAGSSATRDSDLEDDWRSLRIDSLEETFAGAAASSRPKLASMLEQRSVALGYLKRGQLRQAHKLLLSANDSIDDDWLVNYLLARLSIQSTRASRAESEHYATQAAIFAAENFRDAKPTHGESTFNSDIAWARLEESSALASRALRLGDKHQDAWELLAKLDALEPLRSRRGARGDTGRVTEVRRKEVLREKLLLLLHFADADGATSGSRSPTERGRWEDTMQRILTMYPRAATELPVEPDFAEWSEELRRYVINYLGNIAKGVGGSVTSSDPPKALQSLRGVARRFSVECWESVQEPLATMLNLADQAVANDVIRSQRIESLSTDIAGLNDQIRSVCKRLDPNLDDLYDRYSSDSRLRLAVPSGDQPSENDIELLVKEFATDLQGEIDRLIQLEARLIRRVRPKNEKWHDLKEQCIAARERTELLHSLCVSLRQREFLARELQDVRLARAGDRERAPFELGPKLSALRDSSADIKFDVDPLLIPVVREKYEQWNRALNRGLMILLPQYVPSHRARVGEITRMPLASLSSSSLSMNSPQNEDERVIVRVEASSEKAGEKTYSPLRALEALGGSTTGESILSRKGKYVSYRL